MTQPTFFSSMCTIFVAWTVEGNTFFCNVQSCFCMPSLSATASHCGSEKSGLYTLDKTWREGLHSRDRRPCCFGKFEHSSEDFKVLEHDEFFSSLPSFVSYSEKFQSFGNTLRVNNLYLWGLATGRQLPKVVKWWSIRPSSTSILVASLKHLRFLAYLQVLRTPKIHRIMHWQK